MKKLIVTAIGAAAAFGASAGLISTQRFENATQGELPHATAISTLNEWAGGEYWFDAGEAASNNTYKIEATGTDFPASKPFGGDSPTKALNIETEFGKPLNVNIISGGVSTNIAETGIYFDSLVKFTVCDGEPELASDDLSNAKIALWVQENENSTATNLYIKAGYLIGSTLQDVGVVTNTYKCMSVDPDFASTSKWHRVTIKAFADITKGNEIPGFVVFVDEVPVNVAGVYNISSIENFSDNLNARAAYWTESLFPSMVQGNDADKVTLKSAGFAGTGSLTDIVFTEEAPSFTVEEIADPPATVLINGNKQEVTDFDSVMTAVNGALAGTNVTVSLIKGSALEAPLVFTTAANVTLDFAGFVITNAGEYAAITNSAATLVITNSTGFGGILCTGTATALDALGGTTTITDGMFDGNITATSTDTLSIVGGYFRQEHADLEAYLPEGKELVYDDVTGLNKLADKQIVTHTITFNPNGGTLTGDATQIINDLDPVVKPSDPTREGYTFTGWYWDDDDNPETAMIEFAFSDAQNPDLPEGDITLYAQWEPNAPTTFKVTFMNGGDVFATTNVADNTVAVAPDPTPTKSGYTFNYWYTDDPEVAYDFDTPVTAALTLNAKFTTIEYSVTYNLDLAGATNATANISTFTIETPEFTLLDAGCEGYTFNGWTNAQGNAVSTIAGGETGAVEVYASWSGSGTFPVPPEAELNDKGEITVPLGTTSISIGGYTIANGEGITIVGTTATVLPAEVEEGTEKKAVDVGDDCVKLNVDMKPGLFYGVQKVTSLETPFTRPKTLTQFTGENADAILTVPKDDDDAAFFKVYVDIKK